MITKETALLMVEKNIQNLKILKQYYSDFDVMLKAVKIDGLSISYASSELRNDPEIVLAALMSSNGTHHYEKVAQYMSTHLYLKLFRKGDVREILENLIEEKKIEKIKKEKEYLNNLLNKNNKEGINNQKI
jgi:hypothetical protein